MNLEEMREIRRSMACDLLSMDSDINELLEEDRQKALTTINRLELLAEDLEAAHMFLDDKGAPKNEGEIELSLVGRIIRYKEA